MRYQLEHPPKKIEQIERERSDILPRLSGLILSKLQIYFADEAVFTYNQLKTFCWYPPKLSADIPRKKTGFSCIAVVAAIDIEGNIRGLTMSSKFISHLEFSSMMDRVSIYCRPGPTYLYLDNLNYHHGKQIAAKARLLDLELIFSPRYSP